VADAIIIIDSWDWSLEKSESDLFLMMPALLVLPIRLQDCTVLLIPAVVSVVVMTGDIFVAVDV
jgi:hypothetical protein